MGCLRADRQADQRPADRETARAVRNNFRHGTDRWHDSQRILPFGVRRGLERVFQVRESFPAA